jgi:hypothetical protein
LHDYKFWPHVARVDNVFDDRNPVCSCDVRVVNPDGVAQRERRIRLLRPGQKPPCVASAEVLVSFHLFSSTL